MKTILFLLLALIPLQAWSQELANLTDQRQHWSIGVVAFEGNDLSPENLYLTHSFPLLLRERLEAIPFHFFSEAEVLAYQKQIIAKEQQRLVNAVTADRRARDELFFTSTSPQQKATVYEDRIAANLAAIQELRDLDPSLIPFPESRPLRFVSGADGQLIFERSVRSPLRLAIQERLDVLLWGSFEEIQSFLYLEVNVFDAVLGENVFSYSDAAPPTELYDLVDDLVAELASVLWGRDWSSLRVETNPPQAAVWIDDSYQGRSPLTIPYLLPGEREIRVQAPGFRSVVRTIDLTPYSEAVQEITLAPQPGESFSINSDPEGAAVYEGSEWLGTTPLSIEKPDDLRRFLLRQQGYLDFPLYADSAVGETVTAALDLEDLDPAGIQSRRRDELYRAFGAFALSLPVPLFLWGFGYDYYVIAQVGAPAEAEQTATALYYSYLATVAVSGGLFVNLLVRLVRYLKAADRKA
ncbi:MAG: PEGA domain-containing protein [Spirochaetaceae bacterium]|nr:MAG: PEGA domain-containing protein [Spirochaetaceae bacterium]